MAYLSQLFGLEDKTVFLTGASSGIGEHWAETLCNAGCRRLALLARRTDKLEVVAQQLRAKFPGLQVCAVALDVGKDAKAIAEAFDKAELALGGNVTFDVIINNAGVGPSASVMSATAESVDSTMNINVRGPMLVTQEASRRMIARKVTNGSVINVASIYGFRVGFNNAVYATSKAALVQLTKAMAIELLGNGIRVNAIAPGYYRSEMTSEFYDSPKGQKYLQSKVPSKRLGLLPELDGPLVLLCSNASSNMTGTVVVADGGHLTSSL